MSRLLRSNSKSNINISKSEDEFSEEEFSDEDVSVEDVSDEDASDEDIENLISQIDKRSKQ